MTAKRMDRFESAFSSYAVVSVLGEGGTGRVYQTTDDSGRRWALKALHPERSDRERMKRFKNEIQFGIRNQHANLVSIFDYGTRLTKSSTQPFYVMPLFDCSLRTLLKNRIPPAKVLTYWSQLLDGLEAAHLLGVTHRDLKPENVLYNSKEDRLVIADFGIAQFREEELYTLVETSPRARLANFMYAAPEQRRRGVTLDARADLFALGLILNEMFTGEVPYGTSYKTISSTVQDYSYLDDLVAQLLRQNPKERPNSISILKTELRARGNAFVLEQKLSEARKVVIPIGEVDDPLALDPPKLLGIDYVHERLILKLDRSVSPLWIEAFNNMGSYTSINFIEPGHFSFTGDTVDVAVDEHLVQAVVNNFKNWLSMASATLKQRLQDKYHRVEAQRRQAAAEEIEELERRRRIQRNTRI